MRRSPTEREWRIEIEVPGDTETDVTSQDVYGKLVLDPQWLFVLNAGEVVFGTPAWRVLTVEPVY
jgi:hypothetical protein